MDEKSSTTIYKNRLGKISHHTFCRIAKLEILDLASNKLTQIPPFINKLTSLKKLYLEGNCISVFPDTLGDLKKEIDHNNYFNPIKDFNQT